MNNVVIPMELADYVPISAARAKKTSDGGKSIVRMKYRLIERKELHFRCRRINDMMCVIALLGLVLMIVDTELRLNQISTMSVTVIRPLISGSTVILIGLVLYYHILDIRLYAINNHIADWRVILTSRGLLLTISEVVVCSIHPFPYIHKSSSSDDVVWLQMALTLPSK
jgi:potassium intermediate/small conductance calcium-activated channel subfamily N protein 3